MSASADIMTRRQDRVIAVPVLAITSRDKYEKIEGKNKEEVDKKKAAGQDVTEQEKSPDDLEEVVFIVEANGKVKKMPVKTGIQDNDYIEILSGVPEGMQVVSAPYNTISKTLKDGMDVEVVDKEKIYKSK
jgi:HlyD family secretion protein